MQKNNFNANGESLHSITYICK